MNEFFRRKAAGRNTLLAGASLGLLLVASPAAAQTAGNSQEPIKADYTDLGGQQKALVTEAACSAQMDGVRLGLEAGGFATEATGLAAEVIAAIDPSGVTEAAAVAAQVVGFGLRISAFGIEEGLSLAGVPECNTDFLGGVTINQGGLYASGNSAIGGSLGVDGLLSVKGNLYADESYVRTLDASGAISAHGGQITLGVVDRVAAQPGISIGGGALAGAGHLGPESFSMHATSIAIGNLSFAASEGSTALGNQAEAIEFGTTAIGYESRAVGEEAAAFGYRAIATAAGSTAFGSRALAEAINSVVVGNSRTFGEGASVAIGYLNTASGAGAVAIGDPNVATGRGAVAIGADNTATGVAAIALGADSVASGDGAQATGLAASASGTSALASGNSASANGDRAVALGASSIADGTDAVAIGPGADASFANSVAIGPGAVTSRAGQIALGSPSATISMPGLVSAESLAAQMGPISFVTTDAMGNLATDGGALVGGSLVNRQGVALGIAMQNPDLAGDENGGLAFNWGQFEGAEAWSLSGAMVLARNVFGDDKPGRIAITGSLGVASAVKDDVFRLRQKGTVATRIGGQITW